jgi:hypothetical protein
MAVLCCTAGVQSLLGMYSKQQCYSVVLLIAWDGAVVVVVPSSIVDKKASDKGDQGDKNDFEKQKGKQKKESEVRHSSFYSFGCNFSRARKNEPVGTAQEWGEVRSRSAIRGTRRDSRRFQTSHYSTVQLLVQCACCCCCCVRMCV